MAKISVADALAALQDAGIQWSEEQSAMIDSLAADSLKVQAVSILAGSEEKNLPGKLIEEPATEADAWAEHFFSFAEEFANDFKGEVKNVQGGATRMVRVVGFDTPVGHFKVELRSE